MTSGLMGWLARQLHEGWAVFELGSRMWARMCLSSGGDGFQTRNFTEYEHNLG